MVVERDLLVSLLKLTREGPVLIESVKKDSRIAEDILKKLLEKLQNEDMIHLQGDAVEATSNNRLRLAVEAGSAGADIERVSAFLHWQEFEDFAAFALEKNGYVIAKNLRFKHADRKWEIDIVGCKKPLVICIDCKHWHHGMAPSALKRIAKAQVERTSTLAESLPNISLEIECAKWNKAKFIPTILSLTQGSFKFYEMVPIVPVLQLQDFLNQLPAYIESLKYFSKEFDHLGHVF